MRITHILDVFGGGGKERRCLQIIQGLNKAGHKDIQVIIIDGNVVYNELYDCACHIVQINRKERGLGFFRTTKEIGQHIKSFSPDVVQAWGMMSASFVLSAFPIRKFKFIASYVADVMAPKFPAPRWMINNLCKIVCKGIIGNSQAGLDAYGVPKGKAKLIYNGFNEKRYQTAANKEDKKKELDIQTKHIVIQAARFSAIKDWQCYINTAKIIVSKRKDITFLCAGNGPQWNFYNNQIKDEERRLIKMIGRRSDLDELLQICDLSVLCTNINTKEGLSNSIMESMAFGTPVLATAGGGTPEIIEDKKNGVLIHEQTPAKLALQIEELIDNEEYRHELSLKGIETIKQKFKLEDKTKEYIEYYRKLFK